tara:strand:- start:113 stop:823 length:711 start_codon:yes stop_codon:yes gene_type:complete
MNRKISDILFYLGLFLLIIGAVGLTFMAFFAMFGLPLFIIGSVLILITKKKLKIKLISILSVLGAILLFWFIWTWSKSVTPETFLMSKNYRGKVNIIYGQSCGTSLEINNDRLIYRIPNDGVLIVSQDLETGLINHKFYLIDSDGAKTELPIMNVGDFNEKWTTEKNLNEPPRDKLGVFHSGRVGSSASSSNSKKYSYQEFYISTYSDLTEKFDFKYERKFGSILDKKLTDCIEMK